MEEQATGQLQTRTVLAGGRHPTPATPHTFLRPSPQVGAPGFSHVSPTEVAGFPSSLSPCLLWPSGGCTSRRD